MVTKKDKFLAAAQKYLERGSPQKALVELQNAIKEDPKDTRTWLRMAEVHVRLGQTSKATEVYQKTVDLYVEQGFFQRAVAVYRNIIKLAPDFLDARTKLADVYRQLGLLSDAVQQLEQAALLHQKAGRLPEAAAVLRQMIELSPDQAAPRIRFAELAAQAGQNDEAAQEFAAAAQLLRDQGRADEFVRVAERLLHFQPTNTAIAKEVALKLLERNNGRAALTRLKPCFDLDPRDPEILDLLARSFEQIGQSHKSLPILKELCRVYADAGQIAERNATAQRVLALDPNDTEVREMIARATGAMPRMGTVTPLRPATGTPSLPSGKRPVSITFSEMEVPPALQIKYQTPSPEAVPSVADQMAIASGLVEKPDDDAEIKRILAEADVFVKYGLVERAAEHLRRVFERVPSHVAAHERLAAVLVQLGRNTEAAAELETLSQQVFSVSRDEAVAYARRALELNPGCKRAREVLAAVERQVESGKTSSMTGGKPNPHGAGGSEPELIESGEIELIGEEATNPSYSGDAEADLGAAFGSGEFGRVPEAAPEAVAFDDGATGVFSKEVAPAAPVEHDEAAVAADLEQVDFFIAQALYEEAQTLLDDMEERYPGHMLVVDRRERLSLVARNAGQGAVPAAEAGQAAFAAGGTVIIPGGAGTVGPQDMDTHADLALMNKTMERHDVAIQHFTALLADPAREVYALSMIGESQEALGNFAEAIRCYQDALKRPQATEADATQLYYLLGKVFYNMGDRREALYYFERVSKRDAGYRDVQRFVAQLKTRTTPQ